MVDLVYSKHSTLRKQKGKKLYELQPDIAWDKGKALLWLLKKLNLDRSEVCPIYLGDDVTDEDAFALLEGKGIGIAVHHKPKETSAAYLLNSTIETGLFLNRLIEES